jgi:hypothetical protein
MSVKPYELHQAQDLVKDAVQRADRRHDRWRVLEALYRTGSVHQAEQVTAGKLGEFLPSLTEQAANMILPHINIIQESVIARDPKLICDPIGGGEAAEVTRETSEGVLRYFWRRTRATEQLRDATMDAVRLGSGFMKVSWTHIETDVEVDANRAEQMVADALGAEQEAAAA